MIQRPQGPVIFSRTASPMARVRPIHVCSTKLVSPQDDLRRAREFVRMQESWRPRLRRSLKGCRASHDLLLTSVFDRAETERTLCRGLFGEIAERTMETFPYCLSLWRVHPGGSSRFFLIGHDFLFETL
jgi:hypothetical protein